MTGEELPGSAVGDPAPDFDLPDETGARFRLSGRRGRAPAAVFFFRDFL